MPENCHLSGLLPPATLGLMMLVGLLASSAHGEEYFFDSDGVKICYTDEGAGTPVVLVHGYTATGDLNWRIPGMVDLLAKKYRVITLDNRGHGKSDQPSDVAEYGPKMAADVVRLLDHLKIRQAHVVGYSMGGMITLKLAASVPERMLSGVVGGMGLLEFGPAVPEPAEGAAPPRRGTPALRACARAFPTLGITPDELRGIKVPLEVVIGDQDDLLARRVDPLHEIRPDIPIVKITGANHVTCIFRPEFREAIRAYLDSQPEPKSTSGEAQQ